MNTLDSVRLVLEANSTAMRWHAAFPLLWESLVDLQPAHLRGRYTPLEWTTTVVLFMHSGEGPVEAATRLGLYLTVHKERHDVTPTLAAVQRHAADRILKEPR